LTKNFFIFVLTLLTKALSLPIDMVKLHLCRLIGEMIFICFMCTIKKNKEFSISNLNGG